MKHPHEKLETFIYFLIATSLNAFILHRFHLWGLAVVPAATLACAIIAHEYVKHIND